MAIITYEKNIDPQGMTNPQGRELIDHGTTPFPVAFYYDDMTEDPVAWHWHDELEVVVVESGTAIVAAGTEKYMVTAGNGFFVNTGVLHSAWDVDTTHCMFHSVVFHPRLVGGSMDSIFWQDYVQPVLSNAMLKSIFFDASISWNQDALDAIECAWLNMAKKPAGYEFEVRHALSRLIYLLATHHPPMQNRPSEKALRNGERIKAMLQYIQEHYFEELNTAQIAESAMISESECLRCFRSTIGTTPIQYVKQFRIQKAAELLLTTDLKVIEIGSRCGFQEMSYFAKTFRELRGYTPTQYRKIKNSEASS